MRIESSGHSQLMTRLIYDVPSEDDYPLKVRLERAGFGPVELSARRLEDRQEVRITVHESQAEAVKALVDEHAPDAKRCL